MIPSVELFFFAPGERTSDQRLQLMLAQHSIAEENRKVLVHIHWSMIMIRFDEGFGWGLYTVGCYLSL